MHRRAELAILFADVVDSTKLYEALGDERAREIVRRCVASMVGVTLKHGGSLVTIIGDEVYSTFPTADAAMEAACGMQEAITGDLPVNGRRLAIHVGVHFGPVLIEEGRDPTGDAVNIANRMVTLAKAGQILTTGATVALASPVWRAACRLIDYAQLKGKREPIEVFELIWKADDATLMQRVPRPQRESGEGPRLILGVGDVFAALTEAQPSLTIGRGEDNDVVIPQAIVSRLHARAEYRNGRFVFIDQSANGTHVVPDTGSQVFVHYGNHVIAGSGTLGLGEAPTPGSPTALRYQVISWPEPRVKDEGSVEVPAYPPSMSAAAPIRSR